MPATVDIREWNGPTTGPTYTVKTNGTVRFKNADDPNVDTNNPLVVPSSGSDFSFVKWLRLYIGATGPAVEITNLRFYTDGTNDLGTGILLWCKNNASYGGPTEPTSTTGYTDAFTYTSASPLNLGAGPYTGTDVDIGDFVEIFAEVQSTASNGQTPTETLTFAYDEI